MRSLRSHFVFNKQERSGIFFLLLFLVAIQSTLYYRSFKSETSIRSAYLLALESRLDSLKRLENVQKKSIFYRFNPNFISDFRAYSLGMDVEETDRLFSFRTGGKYLNSARDFQSVTGVSDSLLKEISPYFRFPKRKNRKSASVATKKKEVIRIKDLNQVKAEELQTIRGVGLKLSERIIKYRNYLGGFSLDEQLHEVYGLRKEVVERTLLKFRVLSLPEIKKQNINTISLRDLTTLPYINYEDAKKIISFRSKFGRINSINELTKIQDFSAEKITRIGLYLKID
ncbi:helix-hairpin-helix domain-containing protein [Leptobacterium flavescens]|uniref:Helix-hairpin-helix domain-containing protein n=1 Tax=Leptobacterium flavescens TaxID=472055 RepID=A0A6P0UKA6_9FLAO|nr:helix-hairpin-helix domain-containing protein [Leptobacterium flavescens]NER12318.1 helix-hairpin-helix domain-containing protein [Leptobacterium flavescens]